MADSLTRTMERCGFSGVHLSIPDACTECLIRGLLDGECQRAVSFESESETRCMSVCIFDNDTNDMCRRISREPERVDTEPVLCALCHVPVERGTSCSKCVELNARHSELVKPHNHVCLAFYHLERSGKPGACTSRPRRESCGVLFAYHRFCLRNSHAAHHLGGEVYGSI